MVDVKWGSAMLELASSMCFSLTYPSAFTPRFDLRVDERAFCNAGPTFRAEYSFTSRHLAEFWMIEPEIAFATLEDAMRCAEDYVQFCCKFLLEKCMCGPFSVSEWAQPLLPGIARIPEGDIGTYSHQAIAPITSILDMQIIQRKRLHVMEVAIWGSLFSVPRCCCR
jgi:hypothetical protein